LILFLVLFSVGAVYSILFIVCYYSSIYVL